MWLITPRGSSQQKGAWASPVAGCQWSKHFSVLQLWFILSTALSTSQSPLPSFATLNFVMTAELILLRGDFLPATWAGPFFLCALRRCLLVCFEVSFFIFPLVAFSVELIILRRHQCCFCLTSCSPPSPLLPCHLFGYPPLSPRIHILWLLLNIYSLRGEFEKRL